MNVLQLVCKKKLLGELGEQELWAPLLPEVVAHEAEGPVGVVCLAVKAAIVHDVLEGVVHQPS